MNNLHWKDLQNLVLVAGHAIYTADNFECPEKDENWFLQDFQKGEPPFYIEHIRRGVDLANEDCTATLMFSGGQTRREAGPRSEALSYWMIAEHFNWWWRTNVKLRSTTEEFARDSFENLLFSICRFYECVREFPHKITVVSWEFKRDRFNLHRSAIDFPDDRFEFVGVNNPVDLEIATKGEMASGVLPFMKDPYGTSTQENEIWAESKSLRIERLPNNITAKIVERKKEVALGKKRQERNPFNRQHPYETSCPELSALLQHTGPDHFQGTLPWKKALRKRPKK